MVPARVLAPRWKADLAPAIDTALPPKAPEEALQKFPASRIALVPATRPADVLPVLGWIPGNWESAFPADAPVGFAAVLRSWEERFGARLFALSHDQASAPGRAPAPRP